MIMKAWGIVIAFYTLTYIYAKLNDPLWLVVTVGLATGILLAYIAEKLDSAFKAK